MILQKLLYSDFFATTSLYFRVCGSVENVNSEMVFSMNSSCSFDTYFGSFSICKWKKYTDVKNIELYLSLEGEFLLSVFDCDFDGKNNLILEKNISGETTVPIDGSGVIYFTLKCLSDFGKLKCGYYKGDCVEKNVSLSMVICTYKRENFVGKNIDAIEKNIINNENSPLYKNFSLIVCDNGHTLNTYNDNRITVLHNKNAGGAGGFTRGMLETIRKKEKNNLSHILLTDDDIYLETESIERLYSMLKGLKNEYSEAFIGGSMFRTDNLKIQNEYANRWEKHNVVALKRFKDMTIFDNVVLNEQEEEINYFSWWFCCMPLSVVTEDNLPLPIFIKRDDIEYGLRNGKIFITLNGINVWHEPFENKRPAFLEYYYIRNQCIMEAVSDSDFDKYALKAKLKKQLRTDIFTYRYSESKIRFLGVKDFLKGADFLKNTDPEELNKKILGLNRKMIPISDELNITVDLEKFEKNKKPKESKFHKIFRKFTLNGWLLPSFGTTYIPVAFPKPVACFSKKRIVNYDESTKSFFITKKSIKEALSCYFGYLKICKEIDENFDKARKDFLENKKELTSVAFWEKYLEIK